MPAIPVLSASVITGPGAARIAYDSMEVWNALINSTLCKEVMNMRYCPKDRNHLIPFDWGEESSSVRFCLVCGEKLIIECCPDCKRERLSNANFCPYCGYKF